MFCEITDKKATVNWNWEKESKIFISNSCPIDVEVESFGEIGAERMGIWSMITFDNLTPNAQFSYPGSFLDSPIFDNRKIFSNYDGRLIYQDSSEYAGPIRAKDIIFTPGTNNGGYRFKILNSSQQVIFQEEKLIDTPPTFTVACGEECPEGFCKCPIPEYPGYCCLDCSATAASIRAITNELRAKNG